MENSGTSLKKQRTAFSKVKDAISKINKLINLIGVWLFRLRKPVMALPVAYYALKLAQYNKLHLPEKVGINLQSTGEFAQMITRDMAVLGPLALTGACLLLMFCSKRTLTPWLVSVFTLVLPIWIWIINVFPS